LNILGLSAPTHLWHTPFIIYYFFPGSIPNNQNNKYAELTWSLQGLFGNNHGGGLLIEQLEEMNRLSLNFRAVLDR
tara:strand:+ start:2172 stop:2399 length:228 start_codon:yes stop_codon:yes gene_type:complete